MYHHESRHAYPLAEILTTLEERGASLGAALDFVVGAKREGYTLPSDETPENFIEWISEISDFAIGEPLRGMLHRLLKAQPRTAQFREVVGEIDRFVERREKAHPSCQLKGVRRGADHSTILIDRTSTAISWIDGRDSRSVENLYFDTESILEDVPRRPVHGQDNLALIQIYDPEQNEVALIRVDAMGRAEMDDLREALWRVGGTRTFVHFADEPLLDTIEVRRLDLQREQTRTTNRGEVIRYKISLQNACAADPLHIDVEKKETLSDWGRPILRPDQLRYAAQDVVVLCDLYHHLYKGAPMRQ